MRNVRLAAAVAVLALVVAACGSSETTAELPGDQDPAISSACLAGDPDCQDTFPDSGEPTEPPPPGVPVATVVGTEIDGGFEILGFYVFDGSTGRICEALAESFPPQCGRASIEVDNSAGVDLGLLMSAQGVTWSEGRILVNGSVIDGVFVAQVV